MDLKTLAAGLMVIAASSIPCLGRDPGPIETRSRSSDRSRPSDGFVPERVDVSRLHGPPPRPREHRRLYEQVEDDIDRGKGRVEDQQTYEVRRIQDDRDERLGRTEPRREFDRFEEEVDRRLRLERRAKQSQAAERKSGQTPGGEGIAVDVAPAAVESTLARFVGEQEQFLEAARERYQSDLRTAELDRDEAIRAAGDAPRTKALENRRFQNRRVELTKAYQAYRRKILGSE